MKYFTLLFFLGISIGFAQETEDPKIQIPDQHVVYPGCDETLPERELMNCFVREVSLFVQKNLNLKLAQNEGISGRVRYSTSFKVDEMGKVNDILVKGDNLVMMEEVKRVFSLLPTMQPAQKMGEAVSFSYSLPVIVEIVSKN